MDFIVENPDKKREDADIFRDFFNLMLSAIRAKQPIYQDSWKTMDIQHLEKRLSHKLEEYYFTKNPDKLVSLVNLAMFLHLRCNER